jgi:hypothetical protein
MTFLLNPVVSWVASLFNKYLVDTSLKFAAYKVLLYSFLVVVLPAVLKNLLSWLFAILTSQVDNVDWGQMSATAVELTGFGAWIAVHLRFVDCLSVLITALVIRLTLNFIPFLG